MKVRVLSASCLMFTACFAFGEKLPESLLRGLSSEVFAEREASQAKLLAWAEKGGKDEVASVFRYWQSSDDPEVSKRCLKVLKSLSDKDYLSDGQGYLGIQMMEDMVNLPGEEKPRACIRVTRVVADSPADLSGLRIGDLIAGLNGEKWHVAGAMNQFMAKIADSKPRKSVVLAIKRENEDLKDYEVVLGRRPLENLSRIDQDLKLLDERARQDYFRTWLERQKN